MLVRAVEAIKSFFIISMSDSDKAEFVININSINVVRAKITSITFAILEVFILLYHYTANKDNLFTAPYIYYGSMYILMLVVMIAFFAIFSKLGTEVPESKSCIRYTGIFFIGFILMWSAGITLLDQLSSGQVIVYVVAVIAIAITPFYEPVILFLLYLSIHTLFLIAMPHFQESSKLLLGNSINTTTFVIMSWAISFMRYKKHAEDFYNKKILLKKNDELSSINKRLQKAVEELEKLSMTDGLTGVINRLNFESIFKNEWYSCKRQSEPLSLIMVDIDFFKQYNDNYGHQTGDRCIQLVADVLTVYATRPSDKVARYGGDEFAVLLPHTDKETANNLAEQMRKGVEEKAVPHLRSSVSEYVTISLGINTIIPSDESSLDDFLRNTDKALYIAKEKRNRSVFAAQQN